MRTVMESNPEMRRILDSNPEMARMLSDPQIMRQVCFAGLCLEYTNRLWYVLAIVLNGFISFCFYASGLDYGSYAKS